MEFCFDNIKIAQADMPERFETKANIVDWWQHDIQVRSRRRSVKKMKRWVFVLFVIFFLSGCKGNKEVLTRLSEFPDNSFDISTIEKVDCYLGSGSVYSLSDTSHIEEIYDGLLSISVDTASFKKDLYIEDGDILFSFIDENDEEHRISFLTSEYYFDGEKYYKVREREKLRELMDRARDYYSYENISTLLLKMAGLRSAEILCQ